MLEILFNLPLWALALIIIIVVIIGWKIIKFALKILLVLIIIFGVMFFFDISGILTKILTFIGI